MTTKTKKTAAAKPAAIVNEGAAAAIAADFTAYAADHMGKLELLQAVDMTALDETALKDHKASMLAAKNRAERAAEFAAALNNTAFAAAFEEYALTVKSVTALQIYAQDKLLATLKALAADCALSAVRAGNHSNMMTQRLVAVLDKDGEVTVSNAPRRMHDLFSDKSMGTYSAQASSSRQVLELLGLIAYNSLTRAFSLSERGKNVKHVIAN